MSKFNVGDKVRIVNMEKRMSTYDSWVREFAPEYMSNYEKNNEASNGEIGEVVKVGLHSWGHPICLVKLPTSTCLINVVGLEMVCKKLDVELFRYGKLIYGKILHQDASLTNEISKIDSTICEMNGYVIKSITTPQLLGKRLYIRGTDNEKDDFEFSYRYKSNEEAQEAFEMFIKIIDIINTVDTSVTPQEAMRAWAEDNKGFKIVMSDGVEYVNPSYNKFGCFKGGKYGIQGIMMTEGKWYIID